MSRKERNRNHVRNIEDKLPWVPSKGGSPDGRPCWCHEIYCPVYNKAKPKECKGGLGKIKYGTGRVRKKKWNYCEYWAPEDPKKQEN